LTTSLKNRECEMTNATLKNARTREAVACMLLENTGKHMLDSGGIYGYNFEKRIGMDFDAMPKAYINDGNFLKSLYHHLVDNLIVDAEQNAEFDKFCNGDYAVQELERSGMDVTPESIAEVVELRHNQPWNSGLQDYCEFMGHTAVRSGNSYNYESVLDGVFQWFEIDDATEDTQWAVVQTHNGCDMRGGYSKPVFFLYKENYREDSELTQFCNGHLYCEKDSSEHSYETYNGCTWYETEYGVGEVELARDENGDLRCPRCNGRLLA
jgi:hypothetical protein